MEFFIKLLDNKPVDHPIAADNMLTAYPDVDLNNLPIDWAVFVRVPRPKLSVYENAACVYEWDGDVVTDVWYVHQMSDTEKANKQELVKKAWINDNGPANWIFDEDRCAFNPPVPMPTDGKEYIWVQAANNWVEVKIEPIPEHIRPPYPTDGTLYDFDEENNCWIPMI